MALLKYCLQSVVLNFQLQHRNSSTARLGCGCYVLRTLLIADLSPGNARDLGGRMLTLRISIPYRIFLECDEHKIFSTFSK